MDIQRLRNLTTGKLHTEMGHIYEDIETLTGEPGVMTHQIPRVVRAMEPWLREAAPEPRLWDGKWDPDHTGEIEVEPMNADQRAAMFERFKAMPSPLEGKTVIPIVVDDSTN